MGCLRHSLQQRPGLCLPRTARWNPGWESAQQGTVLPIQLQGSPLTLCFIVVTLCVKRLQQGRWGCPNSRGISTETTWTGTNSPFSTGSQRKDELGFALEQLHQCWFNADRGMLLLLHPRFSVSCLAWSPDPKLPCKTGHSAFPQLKPSCTIRSALPLSLPIEQKEASGLSPYCWDQHLHAGHSAWKDGPALESDLPFGPSDRAPAQEGTFTGERWKHFRYPFLLGRDCIWTRN